ncbi:MAG: hypothetical protein KBD73_03580 [Candidatus Magasanikbacteria bacterium]|nr:hypothetical protein [Candidatus Magasanikbacteria bacterium]
MPKPLHPDLPTGESLHHWKVEEFFQYARNRSWYIFMISSGLVLVLYGILSNNFLFSLIIILTAIILFMHSRQEPQAIPFHITELGVVIGNRFYHYDELSGFYVVYQPPDVKVLFFLPKSPLRPRLSVPLYDINPVEVRETLLAYLPEDTEHTEEPVSHMVARQWRLL